MQYLHAIDGLGTNKNNENRMINLLYKNTMKKILQLSILLFFIISCQSEKDQKNQKITVTNPSTINLTDKAIVIDREKLTEIPKGDVYPLLYTAKGDTIPAQLDDLDGDNQWDELFFVIDMSPNASESLVINWTSSDPTFEKRTSVRFGVRHSLETTVQPEVSDTFNANELPWVTGLQPYQTDGPSWENDKVGFRHYFDGRNAKDLFGKKVSYMSPDSVGINKAGETEDNYHVMEDWGRDILAVGNSVGLGGFALMVGDSLARLGVTKDDSVNNIETTVFNIVTEGPVRSIIKYNYNNWKPLDRDYTVEETTSIWPGMYGYKNEVSFSGLKGDETLLVGLVNSNTDEPLTEVALDDDWVLLFTHDKQTYEKEWWLGMALILPKASYQGHLEAPKTGSLSHTYLAKLQVQNDNPVSYYAIAGWEISDEGFNDSSYFLNYVKDLALQLSTEVEVAVDTNQ